MATSWLLAFFNITACQETVSSIPTANEQPSAGRGAVEGLPIGKYVVDVFEDSKGNLWFGTLGQGVARFDGDSLRYFTLEDGLIGNAVVSMTEDRAGNIWFGTHSGLSKYDGQTFTNYDESDGLNFFRVSCLLVDRAGILWVGTWEGISRFDGTVFTAFPLPKSDANLLYYQNTMNWVTDLMEDSKGNIWFSRDGYGVTKYDGENFTHLTKKDGLPSNNVTAMQEDWEGNIWFGSRVAEQDAPIADSRTGDGGLSKYDGQQIQQFREVKGLSRNDTYSVGLDQTGHIWAGANGHGVYRYDGKNFTLYSVVSPTDSTFKIGVQGILEDRKGRMWFGLSGGLFRLEGEALIHISQEGPWK